MDSIQFIATTPDKLREEIVKDIKNIFGSSKKTDEVTEDILTRSETAKLLKVSLVSLWKWTSDGKLKAYGIGNKVYYKKSEIMASLKPLKSENP